MRLTKKKIVTVLKNPIRVITSVVDNFIMRPITGYKFDKIRNISTNGEIKHSLIDANDKLSLNHATAYQAVSVKHLDILFYLLQNDSSDNHFVDIGCGKGRACFYAYQKYKKVTGIDFSPKLIQIAKNNLRSFSRGNKKGGIKFELRDASLYDLPDEPSLVYLFNPFDEYVFTKFLDRNMTHFLKHSSRIAYVNDVCNALLISYGFKQDFRYKASCGISVYSI